MPFSTLEKNAMLDSKLGTGTPVTVYLAAYVAATEVTGNGYVRVAITNNATNWPAAAASAMANGADFSFPEATGSWGTVDELRLHNHITNEDIICTDTISKVIGSGDTLVVKTGDFDLTITDV
tara:strand:+ start:2711 stop:3079 length:369 start_codon:yes stop_codon:yes gene_type:complete